MFSGRFNAVALEDGTYFVDRDGSVFRHVLNFLRGQELRLDRLSDTELAHLLEDAEFYNIEDLLDHIQHFKNLRVPSNILEDRHWVRALLSWLPRGSRLELCYRGTRDGFGAAEFHTACDNRGPMVLLCQDEGGWVFGGFSSVGWRSGAENDAQADSNAFLFSMHNPRGTAPERYPVHKPEEAVHNSLFCGAVFGVGRDLYVADNCNENSRSYCVVGPAFTGPSGVPPEEVMCGAKKWRALEIEAFCVC
eukprot:TRINITY_DN2514_c0_g1_i6.p2 TRINITY_DN2514_c0_g1~~TRINITY_DN2514_c0_g1_i6.p2  ORF type:complete len:249 (+),score=69.86 TRINITY_DN2514_c0_g1_i6:288-1034(+)